MLTAVLLVGATTQAVKTVKAPAAEATARQSTGECYWVNGIWICEP